MSDTDHRWSDQERAGSEFWGHEPHQTPVEPFAEGARVAILLVRRVESHDPTGMIDIPGTVAAAHGDDA